MPKGLTETEKNKFVKNEHLPRPIGSRSQRLESENKQKSPRD